MTRAACGPVTAALMQLVRVRVPDTEPILLTVRQAVAASAVVRLALDDAPGSRMRHATVDGEGDLEAFRDTDGRILLGASGHLAAVFADDDQAREFASVVFEATRLGTGGALR